MDFNGTVYKVENNFTSPAFCEWFQHKMNNIVLMTILFSAASAAETANYGNKFEGHVNVLVVSYHRSGSSLLGDALSQRPDASYFFEPLFHEMLELNKTSDEDQITFLENIFNCDQMVLDGIRFGDLWTMRKLGGIKARKNFKLPPNTAESVTKLCSSGKVQVIKETRARMPMVAKLVSSGKAKNLKIIHLVRDPRGRINSIQSLSCNKDGWSNEYSRFEDLCKPMIIDVESAKDIPPSQYHLLKYEDLASDLRGTLYRLYKFLDVPFHRETENYLKWHETSKKRRNNPNLNLMAKEEFSTFRSEDFDPNHWKKSLDQSVIAEIETNCEPVMKAYGYEKASIK